jgi:hypothetical protein
VSHRPSNPTLTSFLLKVRRSHNPKRCSSHGLFLHNRWRGCLASHSRSCQAVTCRILSTQLSPWSLHLWSHAVGGRLRIVWSMLWIHPSSHATFPFAGAVQHSFRRWRISRTKNRQGLGPTAPLGSTSGASSVSKGLQIGSKLPYRLPCDTELTRWRQLSAQ